MAGVAVAEQYTGTPDNAWRLLGSFAGLGDVFTGIEDLEVVDDTRTFSMMGMRITEHLVRRDDATRTISYAVVDGVPGIESHEATIRVDPSDAGCEVTWSVTTQPEEAAPLFADTYRRALEQLHSSLDA